MYDKVQMHTQSDSISWKQQIAGHWIDTYADSPRISIGLLSFIRGEVAQNDANTVIAWQGMISELIDWILRYGMPIEQVQNLRSKSYREQNRIAIHAEEALLALLNACARKTKIVSKIGYFQEDRLIAGTWLHRLRGQRLPELPILALDCCGYLFFKDNVLCFQDFVGSDFRSVDMRGSDLRRVNFSEANLINSNLSACDMRRSEFILADLRYADLSSSDLSESD
ncbi:MAG: pentapeptide repeat-containing protein, partial [Bacteroidota bacterium]